MSDLEISGADIDTARRELGRVVTHFDGAHNSAHEAASHVGHGGLANKVKAFADSWDIKRGRLRDSLVGLEQSIEAISETFADIDAQMAKELNKAGGKPALARGVK